MYFGAPCLGAVLDEVEVEHEIERRDADHDQAEDDADRAAAEWMNGIEPKKLITNVTR